MSEVKWSSNSQREEAAVVLVIMEMQLVLRATDVLLWNIKIHFWKLNTYGLLQVTHNSSLLEASWKRRGLRPLLQSTTRWHQSFLFCAPTAVKLKTKFVGRYLSSERLAAADTRRLYGCSAHARKSLLVCNCVFCSASRYWPCYSNQMRFVPLCRTNQQLVLTVSTHLFLRNFL